MIPLDAKLKIEIDSKIDNPSYIKTFLAQFSNIVNNLRSPHNDERRIRTTQREYIKSASAVAGLIYCPNEKKILLPRQFRYPVYAATKDMHTAWIYEAVAGIIDPSDPDPKDTFIRECEEEVGTTVLPENVIFHTKYFVSPGFLTEQHYLFSATVESTSEVTYYGGLDEESEAIVYDWLTYEEVEKLIEGVVDKNGKEHKIIDGKTLMILMFIGVYNGKEEKEF